MPNPDDTATEPWQWSATRAVEALKKGSQLIGAAPLDDSASSD